MMRVRVCVFGILIMAPAVTAQVTIIKPTSVTITIVDAPPTFVVSPTGSDTAGVAGTTSAPWLTLAHACSSVTTPGAVIHLNAGTFTEAAPCDLALGVSLEGSGPSSVVKAGYAAAPLVRLWSTTEGTNGAQSVSGFTLDGNTRTGQSALYIKGRSHVLVHDLVVVDWDDSGVTFSGRGDETDAAPAIYATGNQFYSNTVTNSSKYATYGRGALQIGGQDGMLIHDNVLSQVGRSVGTNGFVVKLYRLGYLKGVKVYSNTITKEPSDGTTPDFAIELWNVLGGVEISNNTIVGATDLDWLSKGTYATSVDFHHNRVGSSAQKSNPENGVYLEEGCSDVLIRQNRFTNLQFGVHVFSSAGSHVFNNVTIAYNVFDGLGSTTTDGSALGWDSADSSGVFNNWQITNNTVYARYAHGVDGFRIDAIGTTTNVSIHNNIVVGASRAPVHMYGSRVPPATIANVSIEHNDFFGNGNGNAYQADSVTPTGVINQNNLTTDPAFVSSSDFHLQAGSGAINGGTGIGLPSDYDGVSVPQGLAPDMGAFERP